MKTVIMAGGKGTRISELFPDIPKPLIPIKSRNGIEKPILQWEIESLRDQGFTEIIISVSHMAELIDKYFGDGSEFGIKIDYYVEETPLGNAGALFKLRQELGDEPFLLLNADVMFEIDFNRMVRFHRSHKALVTLFTHPNNHPYDSGLIIANPNGAAEDWLMKEDVRPKYYKNRVNAGLHIIDPKVLDLCGIDKDTVGKEVDGKIVKVDLDRQILKPLCNTGRMYCYDSPEYCKDMGTPERYEDVCRDFQNGIVSAKSFKNKQKAIFIDRDGTINRYVGFLRNIDDFQLLPGVTDAIKRVNESGYLAIVVTNQPVIARGEMTLEQLDQIHKKLETELGKDGAYIDALYYCPHHPHKGFDGEVSELKIDCDCRKPKPGMLLKAAEDFNIDLSSSWMIGDGENDVIAGKRAKCHTIRLVNDKLDHPNDKVENAPSFLAEDLLHAVKQVLK